MRHDFNEGKYTIINDNGKLTALRYGEPWERQLTGDNLIYWMLVEVDKLKQQLDGLKAENLTLRLALEQYEDPVEDDEDDICSACNGSGEGMYDGSRCYKCKGTGVEPVERDDDECYE